MRGRWKTYKASAGRYWHPTRLGVAWYYSEDYARILDHVVDPGGMPWDYDLWRERREGEERYWKRRGRLVVRVIIDAEEFLTWCAANAVEPDRKALGNYERLRLVQAVPEQDN